MPLSKPGLKTRILTELTAQGFDVTHTHAMTDGFAEAIANAIIDEITTNAVCIGSDTPTGDSHALIIT